MDLNKGAAPPPIDPMDAEQNKVMALLAYIIFFIPLLAAKESRFAMYHANQGTILFICGVVLSIISMILSFILAFIPILGWILAVLISLAIFVGWIGLAILGIINAVNGVAKPLPIIGEYSLIQVP